MFSSKPPSEPPSDEEITAMHEAIRERLGTEKAIAVMNCAILFLAGMKAQNPAISNASSSLFRALCRARDWDFHALSDEMITFVAKSMGFPDDLVKIACDLTERAKARESSNGH